MAYSSGGAASAAAHAAAVAQAIKASGTIVKVSPEAFLKILGRNKSGIVVIARGGTFKKHWRYLSSYKGLAFYTESPDALRLPGDAELIESEQIWIPG